MDPRQHIETYKNLNVKEYVHSLYQEKYLNSLNSVIVEGAKYNKEFSSIPKSVIKSLNEEYDVESPYFNLVKGNDRYKPKRRPKTEKVKKEEKPKKRNQSAIRAGDVEHDVNEKANTFLTTGKIPNK